MQNQSTHIGALQKREWLSTPPVFIFLWLLLFVLYFPTAKAGFVSDFTGWLDSVQNQSFADYINRVHFRAVSLYQVTQFNTYIFYRLFGINPWLWHLLFITLHTVNCCLLFTLSRRLLIDAVVNHSARISFIGVLLFCVSPYISEVIVWVPSFHFLQGLLFILLILVWAQRYLHTGNKKYAWWAAIIYLLSTHSLEVFYVTPWLVLCLALFYRPLQIAGKTAYTRVVLLFFIPELIMFLLRLLEFRLLYGSWVSRIGAGAVSGTGIYSLGKPAKYLFHIVCLGRFFPQHIRTQVYSFCDATLGLVLFYSIVAASCIYILVRWRKMGGQGKVASLLFIWVLITFTLLLPLWFPVDMLVVYDRYTYFTGAFLYMLLAVIAAFITLAYIRVAAIALYALANLRFAIQVSRYWGKAAKIDNSLLHNLPPAGNKIIVLLNLPESMHGIPMIGADSPSEYKLSHGLLVPESPLNNTIYDGLSYNMNTPGDGAHVTVLNDSMVRVTLNQWGTWWWYNGLGGRSYENKDYMLNMIDGGHYYELTMKKPASQYLLLYNVGDKWKVVDMSKKAGDQN